MNEAAHVYQNREDGYGLEDMHFCEPCNGYYGVPHRFDHDNHKRRIEYRHNCACRFHREAAGLPREGEFGWLLDGVSDGGEDRP